MTKEPVLLRSVNAVVQSGIISRVEESPHHSGMVSFTMKTSDADQIFCRVKKKVLERHGVILIVGKRVSFFGMLFSKKSPSFGMYCAVTYFYEN